MQCESMLFFLDMVLIEYIRSCFGLSGETENCHLIYENLSDFHIMDEAALYNSFTSYKKHFTNLTCCNHLPVFVRAWIKTLNKEISVTTIQLRHRFKKDIERYDPELIFRDHDFFESWLKSRADRKRKARWSERLIKEFLQEKRQKIIHYLEKLGKGKKVLETARKELIGENMQLEEVEHHGSNEINAQAWEKYMLQKIDYEHVKKSFFVNFIYDKNISDSLKNNQ